jgi:hypothetical protein
MDQNIHDQVVVLMVRKSTRRRATTSILYFPTHSVSYVCMFKKQTSSHWLCGNMHIADPQPAPAASTIKLNVSLVQYKNQGTGCPRHSSGSDYYHWNLEILTQRITLRPFLCVPRLNSRRSSIPYLHMLLHVELADEFLCLRSLPRRGIGNQKTLNFINLDSILLITI